MRIIMFQYSVTEFQGWHLQRPVTGCDINTLCESSRETGVAIEVSALEGNPGLGAKALSPSHQVAPELVLTST